MGAKAKEKSKNKNHNGFNSPYGGMHAHFSTSKKKSKGSLKSQDILIRKSKAQVRSPICPQRAEDLKSVSIKSKKLKRTR